MRYRLRVESASNPADGRFLHVLQGLDPGSSPDGVTLIESSSGTPFAGAAVNQAVVLFPVSLGATFSGLSYTAPTDASRHLITGLAPGGAYDVAIEGGDGGTRVTVRLGGPYSADGGGVLMVKRT
ncbi:MAG: Serine/threonine kinase associate protein KapC [Chloroflexi bacterium]|nr:Serine/threonine kinase associate protein KapC [Chloroflexota bacterium]